IRDSSMVHLPDACINIYIQPHCLPRQYLHRLRHLSSVVNTNLIYINNIGTRLELHAIITILAMIDLYNIHLFNEFLTISIINHNPSGLKDLWGNRGILTRAFHRPYGSYPYSPLQCTGLPHIPRAGKCCP
ncbi:MAG: hypothetical protein ABIJ04_03785, partial [Bacteroidota bacterium]